MTARQSEADGGVSVTTAEWVDWFNHTRLHTWCDNRPPAEYETLH